MNRINCDGLVAIRRRCCVSRESGDVVIVRRYCLPAQFRVTQ
jgi:hypothetical protein